MSERTQLSVRVSKDLVKELRIIAIQKETTMTDIVVSLLEDYVEKNKN